MRNTQATQLLFELSKPGVRGVRLPDCDVPDRPIEELLPTDAPDSWPEIIKGLGNNRERLVGLARRNREVGSVDTLDACAVALVEIFERVACECRDARG